jgi:hypothetical protein
MSVPKRRWLEKFSNVAGTSEVTFSRLEHEWIPSQPLDVPLAPAVGADYAVNLLGDGPMPKRTATERLRFLIQHKPAYPDPDNPPAIIPADTIDLQVDRMRARLRQIGTGRLWRIDDSSNRQFCKAQIVAMPEFSFGPKNREFVPVSIEFARLSDWFAEHETVTTVEVDESPELFTVTNGGTAIASGITITLASDGTDGFINPRIDNLTTGEWFQVNRTGSNSNHRIRVNTATFRVERSTDGGTTWTNDYANLETGSTQAGLMTLAPGVNDFRYTQASGTPNATLVVQFHAPYE